MRIEKSLENLVDDAMKVSEAKTDTLKESVSEDAIWSAIFDKFKGYMTDDFEDVVKDVIDRVSDYSDTSDIDSAIDDALIYDGPKWEIMQHYQNPENADYSSALESFIEDILAICSELALEEDENEDEDDDEEETDESLKNEAVIFSPEKNAYVGLVTLYTNDGPVTKEVEFKEIGNGLYPVDEKNVFERGLGPMYNGHDIDGKRIYDRYETQEVYDALSEKLDDKESRAEDCVKAYYNNEFDLSSLHDKLANIFGSKKDAVEWFADNDARIKHLSEDVNPLADLQKEPVIELDDGTVLGIEYDNGRLFAGSITNSGIIKEYYIDYDAELSLDANLEKLMEVIGNDAQLSSGWMEVASKEVRDSNGDMTDYTWYTNKHGLNIFMFGDKDVTDPDADYADWETESDTEAQDWFDNYTGFEDDEDEYDLELTDDDMNAGQWYESFDRFVEHKLNSIHKMTNETLVKEYRMFRRSNHEEDRPIKEALRREIKNRKNA